MTYVLVHRYSGDAPQGAEPAAAGAGASPESAVASLREFFKITKLRVGSRPEVLTSAGLVPLDAMEVSPEGFEASQVSDDSLYTAQVAKEHKVPHYLEALHVLVVDDLAADARRRLEDRWEVFDNIEIGLVEPVDRGEVLAAHSTKVPTSHLNQINVSAARRKGLTGQGVRVGILDTGIDANHPEFQGKHISFMEFDPQGFPVSTTPVDRHGHGTHVAGIVAGATCGVAPDADLAVAAVLTKRSSGTLAQILAGYNWLVHQNHATGVASPSFCPVVNASLGASGSRAYLYPSVQLLRNLDRSLLIASIGNSGSSGAGYHGSPGNYDIVVGVGSVDSKGDASAFSDWGLSGSVWKPDLCALGENVWSSWLRGAYMSLTGTSMAAPMVAGVAALLVQQMQPARHHVSQLHAALRGLVDASRNGAPRNRGAMNDSRIGTGSLDLRGI